MPVDSVPVISYIHTQTGPERCPINTQELPGIRKLLFIPGRVRVVVLLGWNSERHDHAVSRSGTLLSRIPSTKTYVETVN